MKFPVVTVKHYVLLLASSILFHFGLIEGVEKEIRSDSTEENGPFYFYYQHPKFPRDCKAAVDQCASEAASSVFLIKPDGYVQPFEVYCDNNVASIGWTIIMRRIDGYLDFTRNWEDYKNGFGFPSGEFWLGNEKLSYLSNQATYELQIDVLLSNGSSFYVNYDSFRISDEWSQYALVSLGTYIGNGSSELSECPYNSIYGNCTCQPTCNDPSGSNDCLNEDCIEHEACVCIDGFLRKDDDCVLPTECGCYIAETDSVIPDDQVYVNSDCSEKCICRDDHLICNTSYECSPNAACRVEDGVRQCYCNEGYEGDGQTCSRLYTDCLDVYQTPQRQNGVYTIFPVGWTKSPFEVYCDMTTAEGGWTVFQRRGDGTTDFYRNWESYQSGFGSVNDTKDFWLGNEQLYYLTNQGSYKLRVDIVTSSGTSKYEEYSSFRIGSNSTKYQLLDIGSPSGTAGNGMQYSSGQSFSTHDSDNDQCDTHNCAMGHRGAWWYGPSSLSANHCGYCSRASHCDQFRYGNDGCNTVCSRSNLNGRYTAPKGENIYWDFSGNCNLRSAEMKIRPSS